MRKTLRKNKTNQTITWPTADKYFTIDDLFASHPDFVKITLRVKLKKAISEENLIAVIGTKNCGKGRPKLVLAMRPVKQSALESAKIDGILIEEETKLIPFMDVNSTTKTVLLKNTIQVLNQNGVV